MLAVASEERLRTLLKMKKSNKLNCQRLTEKLIDNLHNAFHGTKPPSALNAAGGNVAASGDYSQAAHFFSGKYWGDIDYLEFLETYPSGGASAVNFLSQVGFFHYLPLFMICVLRDFKKSDLLVDTLVSRLTPPEEGVWSLHFRDEFDILKNDQSKVVAHFLKILSTCHAQYFIEPDDEGLVAPDLALKRYWLKFI